MNKKYCADCGAHVMASFVKCPKCGSQKWSNSPVTFSTTGYQQTSAGTYSQTGVGSSSSAYNPASPRKGFFSAVSYASRKTLDPKGRASRSEYWYMVLFNIIVSAALITLMVLVGSRYSDGPALWFTIAVLVTFYLWAFLCLIMLTIRRLHDLNLSGWWALPMYFAPSLVGALEAVYPNASVFFGLVQIMIGLGTLILFCQRGNDGSNRFGPSPFHFV